MTVDRAIRRYAKYRGTTPGPLFQTRGQRGKARDGRLETRSVLRIIRELGQRVGLHVWCHSLRHTSITQAAELWQKAGLGLDKIKAHSRHRSIATLMLYVDEHDRGRTQATLADLVPARSCKPPLTTPAGCCSLTLAGSWPASRSTYRHLGRDSTGKLHPYLLGTS
jgi:integrase